MSHSRSYFPPFIHSLTHSLNHPSQVSVGVLPGPDKPKWDLNVSYWMRLYRRYGHMYEGGITTLRYDTQCCHTNGECEWEVCADSLVSRLRGGQYPAAGLYIGHPSHTTAPPDATTTDNTTILLFAAWGVPSVSVTAGVPEHNHMRVLLTSPSDVKGNISMSGGFLNLKPTQRIAVTELDEQSRVIRRRVLEGTGDVSITFPNYVSSQIIFERENSFEGESSP